MKINVLDHGYVVLRNVSGPTRRLWDLNQPDGHALFDADDIDPANSARMSFDQMDSGRTREQDLKLCAYLMKNLHTSPFEMIEIWLEMKLPIFVARQFVRHRTCLSYGTQVQFNRPDNGRVYPYEISRLVKNFADPRQRSRIVRMQLRGRSSARTLGVTSVLDAWHSGVKKVYRVKTLSGHEVIASADHRFMTDDGWVPISDLAGKYVEVSGLAGSPEVPTVPVHSSSDLVDEQWKPCREDGYEVSSLGRVRTYWGQGARRRRDQPTLKAQTLSQGRFVVSIGGKVRHVAHLVAEAFLGDRPTDAQVLHRDDNELDNRLSNLRYGTPADNRADAKLNGGQPSLRLILDKVMSIESAGQADTFDITVSNSDHSFLANGVVTHNCSINEVSGRYVQLPDDWYVPEVVGGKAANKKQGQEDNLDQEAQAWFKRKLLDHNNAGYALYEEALAKGVAAEHARMLLQLNHYTHWLWKQDLHNMMHFLSLRDHPHAQVEAQAYAKAITDLLRGALPESMKLYDEYRRRA